MRQDLFVCPRCRTALDRVAPDRMTCPRDGLEFWNVDGIWRFLLPESEAHFARFIADYESVRRAEQRGSNSSDYYRALPFRDLSRRHTADWRIRARSYNLLVKNVLTRLQNPLERSLRILDLGAGNGWLSTGCRPRVTASSQSICWSMSRMDWAPGSTTSTRSPPCTTCRRP